ncbi:MAG: hypothetical protein M0024_07630 [Nitrospiraceae bacterium]|nr:hypothetical protein [Nitrospiraceae bacterium]
MRTLRKLERVAIRPGEYHVAGSDVVITTILGSCVSACLYDPFTKIIGMNHFLLSNKRYSRDLPYSLTEAGRYGIYAMELLINEMMKRGAKRANLHAKAFGGAAVLQSPERADNFFCVGDVNSRFILDFLKTEGIPLVVSDLGGDRGRVVHFCGDDYSVYVKKIRKSINPDFVRKERKFWQISIEKQERRAGETDIWL